MKKRTQIFLYAIMFINVVVFFACKSYKQEKTTLTNLKDIEALPKEVISYAECTDITLSDLQCQDDKITVDFTNKSDDAFTLLLFIDFNDEFIVDNSDTSKNLCLHSSGAVLFGVDGYHLEGSIRKGQISRSITTYVYNVYDISDDDGTLYAFAVKGEVYPRSILPGKQDTGIYKACSNVLIKKVTL